MTSMSTFTSNEQLLSFTLSLGDIVEYDVTRTGTSATATYVTKWDLETGHYKYYVVNGFPCRIASIQVSVVGNLVHG